MKAAQTPDVTMSLTMSITEGKGARADWYWAEWKDTTPGGIHVSAGRWCETETRARMWLNREVSDRLIAVAS